MTQYISKSAVVAEIERRKKTWSHQDQQYVNGGKDVCDYLLGFLDTLEVKDVQEEPVSEDLEEAARKMATHHSHITGDVYYANDAWFFKKGAQWQKGNLWKNAQGDDLPEIDREVVVLYEPYQLEGSGECAVGFAHRPPERWYGRNLDGEEHVFEPKTYDKGEWNIPNVVWWLDLDLPIKGK